MKKSAKKISKPTVSAKTKAVAKKPLVKKTVTKAAPKKAAVKASVKAAVKPAKSAAKSPVKGIVRKPVNQPLAAKGVKKIAVKGGAKVAKASVRAPEADEAPVIKSNLPKKELEYHRDQLLKLRDRIVDEISFLANDSLNRSQKDSSGDLSSHSFHMADQGTDNFDREFAASLLSSEQDVLYEIDEALRRIDQGTYGICEMSGKPIEKERLKFLPFARYSVAVQSEMERGRPRYRPFRRTSIQQTSESST